MLRKIVLGTYKTGKTARAIAKKLDADYSSKNETVYGYKFVFRYGNAYTSLGDPASILINGLKAIELACNKPRMRAVLLGHEVPAPRLFSSTDIIEMGKAVPYPLVGRPANHYKGKNFRLVETSDEAIALLRRGYYLQELVLKGQEYRIFVFNGRVFETNLKEPRVENANQLIRNHGNGWRFKFVSWDDCPEVLRRAALNAADLSGLTFCAVDCCMAPGGKPYVFEVNSGPGLTERKQQKLATKIREVIERRS